MVEFFLAKEETRVRFSAGALILASEPQWHKGTARDWKGNEPRFLNHQPPTRGDNKYLGLNGHPGSSPGWGVRYLCYS